MKTHHIEKQIFDLHLPNEENAYQLQNELISIFKQQILPEMEQLFDQFAPNDQLTISIDTLEIDLGILDLKKWQHDFVHLFYEQLSKQLLLLIPNNITTLPLQHSIQGDNVKIWTETEILLRYFSYYLQYGILNNTQIYWNFEELTKQITQLIQREPQKIQARLQVIAHNPIVIERFVKQFQPDAVNDFTQYLLPSNIRQQIENHIRLLLQLLKTAEVKQYIPQITSLQAKDFEQIIKISVIQTCLQQTSGSLTANVIIQKIIHFLTQRFPYIIPLIEQQQIPTEQQDDLADTTSDITKSHIEKAPQNGLQQPTQLQNAINENLTITTALPQKTTPTPISTSIYIHNSGLVLLWPYLSAFFKHLDLVENKRFIDSFAQETAVYTLQYMAIGEQKIIEPDLALNKLLCSMRIETPINADIVLAKDTQIAANELLEAAIKNWAKLGKTSIPAFREAFLQREGKLSPKSNGWELHIAPSGIDILLDFLPYSINIIKLPWLSDIIWVNWR